MANLRDIKKRISSVNSTKQIAHTMEMVSTAKIRRALENAYASEPYKDAIKLTLIYLAESSKPSERELKRRNKHAIKAEKKMNKTIAKAEKRGRSVSQVKEKHRKKNIKFMGESQHMQSIFLQSHDEVKRAVLIVIASDRGLAGGFNISTQRAALEYSKELESKGVEVSFITCGKKPSEFFKAQGVDIASSYTGKSADPDVYMAEEISAWLVGGFLKEEIDEVTLFYHHAKSRVEQVSIKEQLLPLDPEVFRQIPGSDYQENLREHYGELEFEYEPSPSEILMFLIPSYVRSVLYHALLDSAAAEHGARRRAMSSAVDNATEIISSLNRSYNRIRQSTITTELSEIVGGAAALEDL